MMRRLVFLFIVVCLLPRIAHAQGAGIFSAWPEGVIDAREYSSVNAAIVAIGSTSRTLLIASAQTINSNLTVPSNVQLWFTNGGLLTINTGVTLTINGSVSAPAAQQIFGNVGGPDSALGLVNFGNSSVPFVTPQWFGAKQDNATDDHRALTAALYAGQVAQSIIPVQLLCSSTRYMTSAAIELPRYTYIRGCKSNGSIIRAVPGFTSANLMQNWRAAQGSAETPPTTTSGTGYPSQVVFLEGFQLDANNQAINLLSLIHLQEGTVIRDLVLQGQFTPIRRNALSRDGIRLFTNSDPNSSTQGFGFENIIFYGQFRRCIDANNIGWISFNKINCASANRDYIRVVSAEGVSFSNLEILVPQSTTDDTQGDAALSLKDCTNCSGDNITLGLSGALRFTNYVGLLLDCSAYCASHNYLFRGLRTTYNGAGAARYAADIRDRLLNNPENTDSSDQQFTVYSRSMRISQTGSANSPYVNFNQGVSERSRAFNIGEWTHAAFSAGDFTANGAMTWTVTADNVETYGYTVIGKTMIVNFKINATSVGGVLNTMLQFKIPGGFVSLRRTNVPFVYSDNGRAFTIGQINIAAGGTQLQLEKGIGGAGRNWSAAARATQVQGQVVFEVQ